MNGPAYPNERRFPLAVPGALLLGPVELTGLAVSGLPIAAALLLAARQWVAGAVTAVVAVAAVVWLGRALYGLARRWVVFVPAGLVLHDPMALSEPVLFPKRVIDTLGPAEKGSDSLDLTLRAIGLALELRLKEKVPMARLVGPRRRPEEGASARLLFTPTRAGAVLAEAARRQIRVAAAGTPALTRRALGSGLTRPTLLVSGLARPGRVPGLAPSPATRCRGLSRSAGPGSRPLSVRLRPPSRRPGPPHPGAPRRGRPPARGPGAARAGRNSDPRPFHRPHPGIIRQRRGRSSAPARLSRLQARTRRPTNTSRWRPHRPGGRRPSRP